MLYSLKGQDQFEIRGQMFAGRTNGVLYSSFFGDNHLKI